MQSGVTRVVKAVADCEDTRPEDMPPLSDYVDADCLDHFFSEGTDGRVVFEYMDYEITYRSDGEIELNRLS